MDLSQDIEIAIESVGRRGDGVGSWQGRPVFVPRALIGETARVELLDETDNGIPARLLEVIKSSPSRVTPPCPVYDRCGGCALQHWDIESYRKWKVERPLFQLERAGLKPAKLLDPVFIPPRTRRRATLAAFRQHHDLRLGYHRARSHDITDVPDCMILTPKLQAVVNSLRPHLHGLLTDSRPADVFVQDTGLGIDVMITGAVGARLVPGSAEKKLMAEMADECGLARVSWRADDRDMPQIMLVRKGLYKKSGNLSVEMPPAAFMQPSAEGESALVNAVMAALTPAAPRKMFDLFAGCGTFAGPMLSLGAVHAVEMDESCVSALQGARAKSISAERRNLFSNPLGGKDFSGVDAIVIDPPRMGAGEQMREIAGSPVPLVVSVSCNPSTFVRDTRILVEGGYKFESLQVVDQFMWSSHIEIVGVFSRT